MFGHLHISFNFQLLLFDTRICDNDNHDTILIHKVSSQSLAWYNQVDKIATGSNYHLGNGHMTT